MFGGANTVKPAVCNCEMTGFQLVASAHAPCTRTIVGLAVWAGAALGRNASAANNASALTTVRRRARLAMRGENIDHAFLIA